jgi:MtN3 and saliva related transmembrane protein
VKISKNSFSRLFSVDNIAAMEFIEIPGLAAGICTSSAALPRVVTTVKTKQAEDVSPFMFTVMLTGNYLWIYYGFRKSDLPIILTHFVPIALDTKTLILKYKYRRRD